MEGSLAAVLDPCSRALSLLDAALAQPRNGWNRLAALAAATKAIDKRKARHRE